MSNLPFQISSNLNVTQNYIAEIPGFVGFSWPSNSDFSIPIYSTDAITWQITTMPLEKRWDRVAYGNGKFIATGNIYDPISSNDIANTMVAVSTNGINWTSNTLPYSSNYIKTAYGNEVFVAIGEPTETAMYSTNGVTWSLSTIPVTNRFWQEVIHGNGIFLAIAGEYYDAGLDSNFFNTTAIISTDGILWTVSTLPIAGDWRTAAYGNGIFIILDTYYEKVLSSTDGIFWEESIISPFIEEGTSIEYISYANNLFVIRCQNNYISNKYYSLYSTNGYEWEQIITPDIYAYDIYGGNNLFVTSGKYGVGLTYSTDGIRWIPSNSFPINSGAGYIKAGNIKFNSGSIITNNQNVTSDLQTELNSKINIIDSTITNPSLVSATLQENIFVGHTFTEGAFYYSTNAVTWNKGDVVSAPYAELISQITYGNGMFVAPVYSYSYYSTNGIKWSKSNTPVSLNWQSVAYGGGVFVAVGVAVSIYDGATNSTGIISTDGITWTQMTMSHTGIWDSVAYGNGRFVAAQRGYQVSYSTNGTTWTLSTPSVNGTWSAVAFGNDKFILCGSGTSAHYSTNGVSWTPGTFPEMAIYSAIAYGNGIFLAKSTNGGSIQATSTNGIAWTSRTFAEITGKALSMIYGNGTFVIPTYTPTPDQLSYTTDGVTWNTGISNKYLNTIASANLKNSIDSRYIQGETSQVITVSAYTLSKYDKNIILNTTAACVLTLPNAGENPFREINIKQIAAFAVTSASSNVKPLTTNVNGTAILSGAGKYAKLISDGYFWIIMEAN